MDQGSPTPDAAVGRRFFGGHRFIRPDDIHAFAAATNDRNDAYYGHDAVAPPLLCAVLMADLWCQIGRGCSITPARRPLAQVGLSLRIHRHLRPWDLVHIRGELTAVDTQPSGRTVTAAIFAFFNGRPALSGTATWFGAAAAGVEGPPASPPPPGAPTISRSWSTDPDQAARVQAVLGPASAPASLIPSPALLAMALKPVVDTIGGWDPRRLETVSARFHGGAPSGVSHETRIWPEATAQAAAFRVVNNAGAAPLTAGRVTFVGA